MKVFTGKVLHTKMDKTATVEVERIIAHPLYMKRIKRVKKYHVHDLLGAKPGQIVRFIPSRPYSKLKRFRLIEIVGQKAETEKIISEVVKKSVSAAVKKVSVKKDLKNRSVKLEKKDAGKKTSVKKSKAKK